MRRKGALLAGVAVAAVLGGAGVAAVGLNGRGGTAGPTAPPVPATAEITRGDLVDTKSVSGRLTYAGEHEVKAEVSGTVTAVPDEGTVIRRGRSLLKVDRKPLTLMYGSLPLYRTLNLGVDDGPDVEQLERNLKALGYGDDMTVDDDFTYATHAAVKEWQEDRGLPETGSVDAAQVLFVNGPVRVAEASVRVGDKVRPGAAVLKLTGTRRVVQVDLDTDDQELARKGASVTVELPGGREAKGEITFVGTVASVPQGGEEGGDENPTIDVEITLGKGGAGRLDQAPVTVEMESERVENVLSVPVEALLALREGGFGVEVVEGGRTRLVPVETGAYGGGRVEISGEGLAEGMKVGVPST
ncbi:peptidoglycan hydrolase-like protein with peptidoglycan-binding domain [Thermocatellispora tengchongensis]|uniref:Peptidoglycan hydrolase-like protein with peptidoglycan-binding domain n=1 Tax=Thermocatellispora tengchongensis TaxID=1073253 RepID=A0A840PGS2_9ACTN|nr:peptidoglycan-binding protein [Thermocatellispora tengchongensis]MBB5135235.1 peptidoglycan hydrolase-like protein with peptidoglycan-binding domain [Thermocatellispora tengchongensis]